MDQNELKFKLHDRVVQHIFQVFCEFVFQSNLYQFLAYFNLFLIQIMHYNLFLKKQFIQLEPNWTGVVNFKFFSQKLSCPRWLPFLKIEVSVIDSYCFILSQNEIKFKLQRYDNEQFQKYVQQYCPPSKMAVISKKRSFLAPLKSVFRL